MYLIIVLSTGISWYSKTPIYRGVWGKGNIRGKSGSAVNRGFVWCTLCMFSPIWGERNGRGISGFNCMHLTVIMTTSSTLSPLCYTHSQLLKLTSVSLNYKQVTFACLNCAV